MNTDCSCMISVMKICVHLRPSVVRQAFPWCFGPCEEGGIRIGFFFREAGDRSGIDLCGSFLTTDGRR